MVEAAVASFIGGALAGGAFIMREAGRTKIGNVMFALAAVACFLAGIELTVAPEGTITALVTTSAIVGSTALGFFVGLMAAPLSSKARLMPT